MCIRDRCLAEDLMAGFYYRSLQVATSVLHKCKIGYCRSSWKDKCKRRLPCETLEPEMRFDSNIQRVIHQRRNLYDDARVTSHSPELLLRTGMNIQINVHHPDDAHQSLATCVVERLRSFGLSISWRNANSSNNGFGVSTLAHMFVMPWCKT